MVIVSLWEILSRSTASVIGSSPPSTNAQQLNLVMTEQQHRGYLEENESRSNSVGAATQNLVGGPQKVRAVFRKLIAERITQKPGDGGMVRCQRISGRDTEGF